jgi:hypothetical protein
MKKLILYLTVLIMILPTASPLKADIIINEVSAGGSTDWIELKLTPGTVSMDISPLFVTMYYGTNEALAGSPVTLYSEDKPETPWDDRFAVICFSALQTDDETDIAGDLNSNRIREIYCANYGLWNTDCSVSIDTDDDPSNNGIIDFMAFSNRDGSINTTIASYINSAITYGMWNSCDSVNMQECCCDIGAEGMNSWSTLSRTASPDTNNLNDFVLTPYATPGRENITSVSAGRSRIMKTLKTRVAYRYGSSSETVELPLFLYRRASVRIRIFNSAGMNIYTGPLLTDLTPGYYTAAINAKDLKGRILTGLYPVSIEAVDSADGRAESFHVTLIVARN